MCIAGCALVAIAGERRGWAADFVPESVGVRAAFSWSDSASGFHSVEAFSNWDLPWKWDLGSEWLLKPQVAASAGWLGDSRADAFLTTLGPALVIRHGDWPVSLSVGSSPTLLSRDDFPSKDLGCLFEFTSYAGLNWDVTSHFRIGYRFQHTSNAGLGSSNPGLNMHAFSVSYVF